MKIKTITKKIILMLCTLLSTLGVQASTEFRLSYCGHEVQTSNGQGSENAGEISAAIFVPQTKLKTLAGNQITSVEAGLVSRINVRELKVWVRKDINGANLAEATISRASAGWNSLTFDTPYTIAADEDGLYIGYTYTNAGTSHGVSFVGTGKAGTSFFKKTASSEWVDMQNVGNLSLEAIVTGNNLPQYDLGLNAVTVSPNLSHGANGYTISAEVSNLALNDVTGFTFTVENAGIAKVNVPVTVAIPQGSTVNVKADFVASAVIKGDVKVSISSIVDGPDANIDNNSLMTAVSFLRNVVVEEFTTESCPNCPAAAQGFHDALESNPLYATRVIPVCHHSAFGTDWLTRNTDKALLTLFNDKGNTYAPAFMFSRQPVFDSYYAEGEMDNVISLKLKDDIVECIAKVMEMPTHAAVGIDITGVRKTRNGTRVSVTVSVMKDKDFNAANPMLTFYVTEDNIKAHNQQGANGDFYHQHVIRYDNGDWGEPVTFSDNAFTKTYEVTLDESWSTANLHFVAFVVNRDAADCLNNRIENAASVDYSSFSGDVVDETSGLSPYTTTPLKDTPQGAAMREVLWSSYSAAPNSENKVAWTEVKDIVPNIITSNDKMYIYCPITALSELAQAWIEGDISNDGTTVTFHTPQAYFVNSVNGQSSMLYFTRLGSDGKISLDNLDLTFSYQNGELTQTDGGVLALTDIAGNFYGYAENRISVKKINEQLNVLPDGAEISSYRLDYMSGNQKVQQTTKVAFVGNEVYISDPVGTDAWMKGTLNGNILTVPTKQYMGSASGYPLYLNAGEAYSYTQTNQLGQQETIHTFRVLSDAAIVFTFNPETKAFSTSQTMLVNAGKDQLGVAYVGYETPQYVPWTAQPATPANPTVDSFFDLDPYASYGVKGCMVAFSVPSVDVDGEFIAQENIYYEICFDGQPVELYGTTKIPYYGNFYDAALGVSLQVNGDSHQLQMETKPLRTISLQSFYVVGESVNMSDVVTYRIVDGELVPDTDGIDEVNATPAASNRYGVYNLSGQRVPANTKGLVIIDGRKVFKK